MGKETKGLEQSGSLTVGKLREFKGFENISDEEAEKIIQAVKEFSAILYHHYLNRKKQDDERPAFV